MPKGSIDFAIETLTCERDLFKEKIEIKRSEARYFHNEVEKDVETWEQYVQELNAGLAVLNGKGNGSGLSTRRPPRHPAKCKNGKSYGWCMNCCPKKKARTCDLINYRKKK